MKKIVLSCCFILCGAVLFAASSSSLASKLSSSTSTKSSSTKTFAATDAESVKDSLQTSNYSTYDSYVQLAISNADYMVTAGDVYTLGYAAGTSKVEYTIVVDSTYKIRVSNLAVLDVSNKSYMTVKKQVEEIVQKNYPMSGVQFVLTRPASFLVTVKGEVTETTERSAWALTRLSTVINKLTTDYSSTRDITITGTNGKSKVYDLFKASRDGDLSQNPYVRPGDVITVNRIQRNVEISGEIEREGQYQLKDGENLKELIEYYGNGFTDSADKNRIYVTRIEGGSDENFTGEKIYITKKDLENNFDLMNNDIVTVSSISDLRPVIYIEGAISTSSDADTSLEAADRKVVQFETGMTYDSLIRQNSVIFNYPAANLDDSYIRRGTEIIPLSVCSVLYDVDFHSGITVEKNDMLIIPFRQYFVTVAGAVYNPGRYPYIPDRTYDYYVGLAGGFVPEKNNGDKVKIISLDGKEMTKEDIITPETTITAAANSGLYFFNQYSGIITTTLTALSTALTVTSVIISITSK